MSAPKRTRQQKTVWLKPKNIPDPSAPFRKKVLDYPHAELAFAKVTRPGVNQELVWWGLWQLACRADESRLRVKRWYFLSGLPLHTLRRFPDRVRRWAAEVEMIGKKIRSDHAYRYSASSLPALLELQADGKMMREVGTAKRAVSEALARGILERRAQLPKLAELPNLLRLYSDWIEAVCKLTAHHAPWAPARFKANLMWALIECVTRATGKPHFPEMATLLTAAYHANGSSEIVYASNLKMQYSRYSRRKTGTIQRQNPSSLRG